MQGIGLILIPADQTRKTILMRRTESIKREKLGYRVIIKDPNSHYRYYPRTEDLLDIGQISDLTEDKK